MKKRITILAIAIVLIAGCGKKLYDKRGQLIQPIMTVQCKRCKESFTAKTNSRAEAFEVCRNCVRYGPGPAFQ